MEVYCHSSLHMLMIYWKFTCFFDIRIMLNSIWSILDKNFGFVSSAYNYCFSSLLSSCDHGFLLSFQSITFHHSIASRLHMWLESINGMLMSLKWEDIVILLQNSVCAVGFSSDGCWSKENEWTNRSECNLMSEMESP